MYGTDKGTPKVFLIDFGLASGRDEKIKGFRGTARYAHRSIFYKYPRKVWVSDAAFDCSSLAFSMAALSSQGKAPWSSFQPISSIKESQYFDLWAISRSDTALKCLEEIGFLGDWLCWCQDE
jgi:hypothetical protein